MATPEQLDALRDVYLAMGRLTELWDDSFNDSFSDLPEELKGELLTCSFDRMAGAWREFGRLMEEGN